MNAFSEDTIAAISTPVAAGGIGMVRISGPQALEELDLFQVAELRRGKNGVEVKFFDRIKALEALAALDRPETAAGTALPFYRALLGSVEQPAEDGGRDD